MLKSYFVIVKKRYLFTSSIEKIILFNNLDIAYEYALDINMNIRKDKINTINQVLDTQIVWSSAINVFPIIICKIIPIDNDIMWNIYQTIHDKQKIIPHIYKELLINNFINE
jgi:hypothetical protein